MELGRSKGKGTISRTALEFFRELARMPRMLKPVAQILVPPEGRLPSIRWMMVIFQKWQSILKKVKRNDSTNCEANKRRKRKRNIMNDKQIALIEHALLDEPEMQRIAALLQSWADKLSVLGTELTSSQLKNWLNNRKAKLARVAKEAQTPSEGDNACPDKPGGYQLSDSPPESPSEEFYVPSPTTTKRVGKLRRTESSEDSEIAATEFTDSTTDRSMQQMNCTALIFMQHEPGQYVALTDREGKEIGRGRIHQVRGRWHGKSLEQTRTFIVDVIDLKVDRWTTLPHPSEVAGTTFTEAEAMNGVMRVAWDSTNILLLPQ